MPDTNNPDLISSQRESCGLKDFQARTGVKVFVLHMIDPGSVPSTLSLSTAGCGPTSPSKIGCTVILNVGITNSN